MICPECGIVFRGGAFISCSQGKAKRIRRCPNGHEFDEPKKPMSPRELLNAAAPELLEALKSVLECFEYPGDINYHGIRDLIAKATGGER